jgi:hypothetical protein
MPHTSDASTVDVSQCNALVIDLTTIDLTHFLKSGLFVSMVTALESPGLIVVLSSNKLALKSPFPSASSVVAGVHLLVMYKQ